jgi:two-component system response regulator HydG
MSSTDKMILIVEDDLVVQKLLADFLTAKKYKVVVFKDAEMALAELEQRPGKFTLVLADLVLPAMTGLELIQSIKALEIEIPVILMTAQRKVELAADAVRAGAYCFIQKPVCFPELLITIERAIQMYFVNEENRKLKSSLQNQDESQLIEGMVGRSPAIRQALDLARRVSKSTSSVLVTGESGTGKELIAKAVHNLGCRRRAPFVAINCGAIPENLLESELFGHARGAFTGAVEKKAGLFEEAEGGTLFLDEIGDLILPLQAKLLRVLQEKKVKRVGENNWRDIDVRIVSATHRDLRKEIQENRFREDLFFRLNVIPISISPLRERREDILPLADYFLKKFALANKSIAKRFSKEVLQYLLDNPWRGNVRELENTIERAVVLNETETIQLEEVTVSGDRLKSPQNGQAPQTGLFDFISENGWRTLTVEELTDLYVEYVLKRNGGAKSKTAKDLGIDRKTLSRKLYKEIPLAEFSSRSNSAAEPALN